jgi:hypothetical protein
MIGKKMLPVAGVVLLCAAGNAFAATGNGFANDGCDYQGLTYPSGSRVCQLGIQFVCEAGEWNSLQVKCPAAPAISRTCYFNGSSYSSGSMSCQLGGQYRCDAGVWTSLGVACRTHAGEPSEIVLSDAQAADDIRVMNVQARDGLVTGSLFNTSRTPVRNVELLVRHTWFWNNERHPGDDSPGRADVYDVPGEIPPRQQMPFTYHVSPPLLQRPDGHFETTVEIVGFAQVGG